MKAFFVLVVGALLAVFIIQNWQVSFFAAAPVRYYPGLFLPGLSGRLGGARLQTQKVPARNPA
jgi:hypothetical protein